MAARVFSAWSGPTGKVCELVLSSVPPHRQDLHVIRAAPRSEQAANIFAFDEVHSLALQRSTPASAPTGTGENEQRVHIPVALANVPQFDEVRSQATDRLLTCVVPQEPAIHHDPLPQVPVAQEIGNNTERTKLLNVFSRMSMNWSFCGRVRNSSPRFQSHTCHSSRLARPGSAVPCWGPFLCRVVGDSSEQVRLYLTTDHAVEPSSSRPVAPLRHSSRSRRIRKRRIRHQPNLNHEDDPRFLIHCVFDMQQTNRAVKNRQVPAAQRASLLAPCDRIS